ncbi:MAG: hypothetical protein IJD80_01525 [Oscillospiraceae bacterium]|nr:hypothetical protein [Oscillospiraceae bacterium]
MKKHTSRFFAVVMIAVISIISVLPAFAAKSEAEIQPLLDKYEFNGYNNQ